MLKRFSVLPCTLYRIQSTQIPQMRNKEQQYKKNRTSYDFILGENQLYNPIQGQFFTAPNGLSLRPIGLLLSQLLPKFNAKFIYQLPINLTIPQGFVLILEHGDHYSLQTTHPIKPKDFQKKAGQLFSKQKLITKDQLTKKIIQTLK